MSLPAARSCATLSAKFDEFWNSSLAIPAEALAHGHSADKDSSSAARHHSAPAPKLKTAGFDYQDKLAHGEPLAGVLDGELSLVWADAQFIGDSPDKKNVVAGDQARRADVRAHRGCGHSCADGTADGLTVLRADQGRSSSVGGHPPARSACCGSDQLPGVGAGPGRPCGLRASTRDPVEGRRGIPRSTCPAGQHPR